MDAIPKAACPGKLAKSHPRCNLLQSWFTPDFFLSLREPPQQPSTLLHSEIPKWKMQISGKHERKWSSFFSRADVMEKEKWKAVMSNKLNEQLCFITVRSSAFTVISLFYTLHKKLLLNCLECSQKRSSTKNNILAMEIATKHRRDEKVQADDSSRSRRLFRPFVFIHRIDGII